MFHRIFRSLIALATIIVVYQAYVLLAVPLIEPPLVRYQGPQASPEELAEAQRSVSKYQELLRNYFPPDHWSLTQPPKIIGNWPVLLVVDNYTRKDNGWIDIHKFAVLIFPTPLAEGQPPPRDVVVLEAPGGAQLQFDENFRPDRFQIGQIVQGKFPGAITIRSEMRDPGPEDDLFVETSDLAMNSKLLYTASPIRFRMGENVGSGRELEIRFVNDEPAAARKMGISSLEIRRDVQLRIDLKSDRLLPGGAATGSHAERGNELEKRPPVDVTCTGPFQFDFVRHVASFDQNAQVRQLDADGSGDRLDAQQLDIHFTPKATPGEAASAAVDGRSRQQSDLSHLEPTLITAQGQPVVVVSPSRRAEARAQRVQLDLRGRRVMLDGGRDTTLIFGLNKLVSPRIEYWHPATDSGSRVGRFRASGTGSLYYVIDPANPDQVFQAAWQKTVELGRSNGQPVLTLDGRPQLGVAGMGSLAADQLTIWFRELVGAPASAGGIALPGGNANEDKSQLLPDRLIASGQVDVGSPRLSARTEQLAATFETLTEETSAAAQPAATSAVYSSTSPQPKPSLAKQLQPSRSGESPTSSYHVDADRLQLGVRLQGRDASPTSVECDGNVVLREISLIGSTQQPFEVRGARLTAIGLENDAAQIKIVGSGVNGAAQYVSTAQDAAAVQKSQLAQLAGRGMSFFTAQINIDQRENRLWSDGPGQATIVITRDLGGRGAAAAAPTPFEIEWQNGMVFDGRVATFRGNIRGRGDGDSLRCDQMLAKLAAPINFAAMQGRVGKSATEVAEVEFQGQVMIDHVGRDEHGPTSHDRMELARLAINQETGVISGMGPGIIRSTRFGAELDALGALPGGQRSNDPNQPRAAASKLNFARIDFDERLGGNLYLHELWFNRRVRAIYGPVDSWDQELDGNQIDLLPPKTLLINCDELRANEDPVAARANAAPNSQAPKLGPLQLVATGNVQIDGRSTAGSRFIANGVKASYDESKRLIQLDGDGRTSASVQTIPRPGEPSAGPIRGNSISYSLDSRQPQINNFQGVEITFPDAPPTSAQQQQAPRRRQ